MFASPIIDMMRTANRQSSSSTMKTLVKEYPSQQNNSSCKAKRRSKPKKSLSLSTETTHSMSAASTISNFAYQDKKSVIGRSNNVGGPAFPRSQSQSNLRNDDRSHASRQPTVTSSSTHSGSQARTRHTPPHSKSQSNLRNDDRSSASGQSTIISSSTRSGSQARNRHTRRRSKSQSSLRNYDHSYDSGQSTIISSSDHSGSPARTRLVSPRSRSQSSLKDDERSYASKQSTIMSSSTHNGSQARLRDNHVRLKVSTRKKTSSIPGRPPRPAVKNFDDHSKTSLNDTENDVEHNTADNSKLGLLSKETNKQGHADPRTPFYVNKVKHGKGSTHQQNMPISLSPSAGNRTNLARQLDPDVNVAAISKLPEGSLCSTVESKPISSIQQVERPATVVPEERNVDPNVSRQHYSATDSNSKRELPPPDRVKDGSSSKTTFNSKRLSSITRTNTVKRESTTSTEAVMKWERIVKTLQARDHQQPCLDGEIDEVKIQIGMISENNIGRTEVGTKTVSMQQSSPPATKTPSNNCLTKDEKARTQIENSKYVSKVDPTEHKNDYVSKCVTMIKERSRISMNTNSPPPPVNVIEIQRCKSDISCISGVTLDECFATLSSTKTKYNFDFEAERRSSTLQLFNPLEETEPRKAIGQVRLTLYPMMSENRIKKLRLARVPETIIQRLEALFGRSENGNQQRCLIDSLRVDQAYRGRGLERALVLSAACVAAEVGATGVWALAESPEVSELYLGLGETNSDGISKPDNSEARKVVFSVENLKKQELAENLKQVGVPENIKVMEPKLTSPMERWG